jgi:hypothetical protein
MACRPRGRQHPLSSGLSVSRLGLARVTLREWLRRPPRWSAVADPQKIIFVKTRLITRKIRATYDRALQAGGVVDGDWDLHTWECAQTAKFQAIVAHFEWGIPWEDTELFKRVYARRIAKGERIRGTRTLEALRKNYEQTVDPLFERIRNEGFVLTFDETGRCTTRLAHVHIARDGQILYGMEGNHRLAIAKLLGVPQIPCLVRARHRQWQEAREAIAASSGEDGPWCAHPDLADHPDLQDLIPALPKSVTI